MNTVVTLKQPMHADCDPCACDARQHLCRPSKQIEFRKRSQSLLPGSLFRRSHCPACVGLPEGQRCWSKSDAGCLISLAREASRDHRGWLRYMRQQNFKPKSTGSARHFCQGNDAWAIRNACPPCVIAADDKHGVVTDIFLCDVSPCTQIDAGG